MKIYSFKGGEHIYSNHYLSYVDEHSLQVSKLFKKFLTHLSELRPKLPITYNYIPIMVEAAKHHDVGKRFISEGILTKNGPLTTEEYTDVKLHTLLGADYIQKVRRENVIHYDEEFYFYAYMFALNHHEKWDGTGYPRGIASIEIPTSVQVLSIVDVYEALTAPRAYKEAFSEDKAMEIIVEEKGKAFNPELVNIFEKVFETNKLERKNA